MTDIKLTKVETWAPDPRAMPAAEKTRAGNFALKANGTRICSGGWQFVLKGVRGGQGYRMRTRVRHRGIEHPRDCLQALACWAEWDPAKTSPHRYWNYLLPVRTTAREMDLEAVVRAPKGAKVLTIRYVFRWATSGSTSWDPPQIEAAEVPERRDVKACVVNATRQTRDRIKIRSWTSGSGLQDDVAEKVDLWASLVRAACRKRPDLIVTPEIVISGEHAIDGAVEVPGPATAPFQEIAGDCGAHIVLGLKERDGDAVYNSAVLIADGKVQGRYRKVHLATGEDISGTRPGDDFTVFDTPLGRIGCLICMDTTVSESARMLGLNGADFICFPIMGDLRADRFSLGQPIYNESRWKAIMRTRAIDNQVTMVIARNDVQGSCIIDRKGDILAWNEGDEEFTCATVPGEDGYRVWGGGDFREVTYMLRRPHLYGPYSDESCLGPMGRGRRG
jgi:predicted amidohydrolase